MGAFFLLWSSQVYAATTFCSLADAPSEFVTVQYVIDGDTLRLRDGRNVRLIGINAPELEGRGRTAEPYAVLASRHLAAVIKSSNAEVALRLGELSHDRYGRVLAHLYDRKGASIEEQLVAAGLAYHVVIAPNTELAECLAQAEHHAQRQRLGLWKTARFTAAQNIQRGGFTLLQGRINKVQRNRGGVWLELGHSVTVNIPINALPSFKDVQFEQWQGRTVQARGWVSDRKRQHSKYARWRLTVSHPSMLTLH